MFWERAARNVAKMPFSVSVVCRYSCTMRNHRYKLKPVQHCLNAVPLTATKNPFRIQNIQRYVDIVISVANLTYQNMFLTANVRIIVSSCSVLRLRFKDNDTVRRICFIGMG